MPCSDSKLAVSESGLGFGCFDFVLGMLIPWLMWLCRPVVVRGGAMAISRSHVHPAGVLAGTAAVSRNTESPARAVARRGAVSVLQRLVLHAGIGVGREGPDPLD